MRMKRRFLFWGFVPVIVGLLVLFVLARPARAQAVTCNIALGRTTINQGESTTLSWYSSGATPVVVDGLQVATGHGSKIITPSSSRSYSIVVGWNSACTKSISITVNPVVVTCSISASSTTIFSGNSTTLNWSSSNGSNWGISPSIGGTIRATDSRSVSPTVTTTYSFVVNYGSSNQCLRTVTVNVRYRFTNNRPNVPARFSWSNGTYCGGGTLLHDRAGWLSASGNTSQESASVGVGQNSVAASINLVGRACTAPDYSNADPNDLGRVRNRSVDGDSIYVRSASTTSSPNVTGISSTLQGKSVSISRAGQYAARPGDAWTGIASASFSVDGFSGLSPGTYNITITADVVYTSILNGSLVCSANQAPTSSVVGSNCPTNNVQFTISITVPPGSTNPPSPQCEMFGPSPSIISAGESSELGWSVTDAETVQLSVNGVLTSVGHVVTGYSVSPQTTTQYFIIATDDEGEQVTCSLTVTVQDSPEEPETNEFKCEPIFYQSIVITTTSLTKLNVTTGVYENINPNMNVPNINAIGYNILDNYIYGLSLINGRYQLRKVDSAGNTVQIPLYYANVQVQGSPGLEFVLDSTRSVVVGDFDGLGNLWVISTNPGGSNPDTVYRIDVNDGTGVARAYPVFSDANSGSLKRIQDWVFIGNSFYGIYVDSTNKITRLVRVPTTASSINDVIFRPFVGTQPPADKPYGALWTTIDGKLYAGYNDGGIYEISNYEITAGGPPAPSISIALASSQPTVGNDGASCPNAEDPLAKVNYPFVRVKGSDVISGSVFGIGNQATSCSSRRELYPSSGLGKVQSNGSRQHIYNATDFTDIIMGSSSAEYAVFALGQIDSGRTGSSSFIANNGYYRPYSTDDPSRVRDVSFANNIGGEKNTYGTFYSTANLPCVDITEIEKDLPAVANVAGPSAIQTQIQNGNGIIRADTDVSLPSLNLGNNGQVVLYVNGDVSITGNITGGFVSDGNGVLSGAQLTVIARGNISIDPGVTQIDAYLIAHDGTLNTCSNTSTPTTGLCSNKLTVNGGLVGRKIEWRRNFGTLGTTDRTLPTNGSHCAVGSQPSAAGVNSTEDYAAITDALNDCAAEFVNFDPSFYFANPFTLSSGQGSISGKPLNTTELPPVY